MANLTPLIRKIVSGIEREWNYRSDRLTKGNGYYGLVRRESEAVASYVSIFQRPSEQHVRCDFWVAPFDAPSDSLENLFIGYRFRLAETWEAEEAVVRGFVTRFQLLQPHVPALVRTVELELREPPIVTGRLEVYRDQLKVYATLLAAKDADIVRLVRRLQSQADAVASNLLEDDQYQATCRNAAVKLTRSRWVERSFGRRFQLDVLAHFLSTSFHMNALAPWPPAVADSKL